jgi:hypothetical protein
MKKLALLALVAGTSAAVAQPASFIDLGVIGGEGIYVFNTDNSVNTAPNTFNTDTEMGLWDAAGTLIAADDDGSALNLWSQITANLTAGMYFIGISEFNSVFENGFLNTGTGFEGGDLANLDLNINGTLAGEFNNASDQLAQETAFFKVTVVPAPASAGLLAFGGLLAARRRR